MAISLNWNEAPQEEFPCLKSGCRFRSETFNGTPFQVLEDPATGNFFRLGEAEAEFLRRLDGSLRVSQILEGKTSGLGDRQRRELLELAARSGLLKGHPVRSPPKPLRCRIFSSSRFRSAIRQGYSIALSAF